MIGGIISTGAIFIFIIFIGLLLMLARFYKKVEQGQALVRNGLGGTRVSFSGIFVIPIIHRSEYMDISIKRVNIDRHDEEGLICKDNLRADIKVAFFVRVNKTDEDVLKVAQSIGCSRASIENDLQSLFEAKFSEALKTVGKQFDFVDLYNSREQFKEEIIKTIGTDLNGFILDDAAIDFLEQTHLEKLDPNNILDSQGIKKITELTATQKINSNAIERERDKTIKKQNVEAQEAILELDRQQAEAENRQKREVESLKAREEAETKKIQQEERLKAEKARISTEEEISISEENKERQIIVARKNKERTEAVEKERVEKERLLEENESQRVVELAKIEKQKAIEIEQRDIQNAIRERVIVEKNVILEQEKIKDTEAFASAERDKKVSIINAEKEAQQSCVKEIKAAEASKKVAELKAEQEQFSTIKAAEASKMASELKAEEKIIQADALQNASQKEAAAKIALADADIAQKASAGMAEVKVMDAKASAIEKQGSAEAKVQSMKYESEAKGIENKANAMKLLDQVGREHEEFKFKLNIEKEIKLAEINISKEIAYYQSNTLSSALNNAKIDIVGGESTFFQQVVSSISGGKSLDRFIDNSKVANDIKETFFNSDPQFFKTQLKNFFSQFGLNSEDMKNLTISAALTKLLNMTDDTNQKSHLYDLLSLAERSGMCKKKI